MLKSCIQTEEEINKILYLHSCSNIFSKSGYFKNFFAIEINQIF